MCDVCTFGQASIFGPLSTRSRSTKPSVFSSRPDGMQSGCNRDAIGMQSGWNSEGIGMSSGCNQAHLGHISGGSRAYLGRISLAPIAS